MERKNSLPFDQSFYDRTEMRAIEVRKMKKSHYKTKSVTGWRYDS